MTVYQDIVENAQAATGAAFVLLTRLSPETREVTLTAWSGLGSEPVQRMLEVTRQRLPGLDPSGMAVKADVNPCCQSIYLEGKPSSVTLEQLGEGVLEASFLRLASTVGHVRHTFTAPLRVWDRIEGALSFCTNKRLSEGQRHICEAFARQAALTLENAVLCDVLLKQLDDLQLANNELAVAYDATLEGWVRALDLRHKETEGHTQRVTDMAVRLAQAMGLRGSELEHVRRGALLHDIGKTGVPDSILLKPGPLTEEQWATMRRHPRYAHDFLSPIAYLRPALDIPYCHHEKWDGTGYPRGLFEEEMPLAGRLFAVVDVWDALRSDRGYRAGWPEEKVRQHILSLAGTHFDPQVVEAFLRLLDADT